MRDSMPHGSTRAGAHPEALQVGMKLRSDGRGLVQPFRGEVQACEGDVLAQLNVLSFVPQRLEELIRCVHHGNVGTGRCVRAALHELPELGCQVLVVGVLRVPACVHPDLHASGSPSKVQCSVLGDARQLKKEVAVRGNIEQSVPVDSNLKLR